MSGPSPHSEMVHNDENAVIGSVCKRWSLVEGLRVRVKREQTLGVSQNAVH
jgi:hypothetical protein